MITNFETQTHELTKEELILVSPFVNGLKSKIGKDNAITNKQMREAFKNSEKWKHINIHDARIRKIINFIRTEGLVKRLCASSSGYYIAENDQEFREYLQSLQERINSQVFLLEKLKLQ